MNRKDQGTAQTKPFCTFAKERRGHTSGDEGHEKTALLGVVCLFIGMMSSSQDGGGTEGIQDRFVGARRLASLEGEGADGKIHPSDSTGLLAFKRDAHMSVQVKERNPQTQTPTGPEQYSQGGYEASFGTL